MMKKWGWKRKLPTTLFHATKKIQKVKLCYSIMSNKLVVLFSLDYTHIHSPPPISLKDWDGHRPTQVWVYVEKITKKQRTKVRQHQFRCLPKLPQKPSSRSLPLGHSIEGLPSNFSSNTQKFFCYIIPSWSFWHASFICPKKLNLNMQLLIEKSTYQIM